VTKGANVTLTAALNAGIPPATLQWFHNDAPIPYATNGTLILTNFSSAFAGVYSLRAHNALGTITRQLAQLNLEPDWVPLLRHDFTSGADNWSWGSGALGNWLGGYLQLTASAAGRWSLKSPTHLLAQDGLRYGALMEFDLKCQSASTNRPAVRLIADGVTLRHVLPFAIGTSWTRYRVALREDAGWFTENGAPASQPLLEGVLLFDPEIEIEGIFTVANDSVDLDNVTLSAACGDTPPELQISLETNPARLKLTWPLWADCYHLASTPQLHPAQWSTNNISILDTQTINGWRTVAIQLQPSNRFFRLTH
jgi:hypothetical protein